MQDIKPKTNRSVTVVHAETVFATNRVQFAAFLISGKHLPFIGCKPSHQPGVITFLFQDGNQQGPTLEHKFETGASAPARDLFSAHRWLLNQIDRTRNQEIG